MKKQSSMKNARLTLGRRASRAWRGGRWALLTVALVVGLYAIAARRDRDKSAPTLAALGTVAVYKNPGCQCCEKWMQRMREHGFAVKERRDRDVSTVKRQQHVPPSMLSCHTSVVDGYTFEGHVPPDLVAQVLRDRPAIAGLAVAGMPQGAPGMEVRAEPYQVLAFTSTGEAKLFAER